MQTLHAEERQKTGRHAGRMRAEGKLPAVFYGPKEETTPITLSANEFLKVWESAGESSVITLTGLGEDKEVLIHDIDIDPVSGSPRHADFYAIEKGKKVQVNVALVFEGEAPAVKAHNGILVKVMHEVEIEAMPRDLPHELSVDLSKLVDFEARITAEDVKLSEGVALLSAPEEVVALVVTEREEEPEEEPDAPDLDSIEVEQKGKDEEASSSEETSGEETEKETKEE